MYNERAIMDSMAKYFLFEYVGPALHEETRSVWKLTPKKLDKKIYKATIKTGAGGASKAFAFADGRRIKEIKNIMGFEPYPGSLNMELTEPFDWNSEYYRAQVLDVVDRKAGLNSEWAPRWVRIYPCYLKGIRVYAFRFEGEKYPDNFVEVLAPVRLRNIIKSKEVRLAK